MKAFSYIRPIFRERGVINSEVTGRLTETRNGIRVIKGFNEENQEIRTFEKGVEKLFLNVKKSVTSTSLVTSSATFLLGLASTGIMGFFFSSRRRHTRWNCDWSSDVCSSDLRGRRGELGERRNRHGWIA